MSAFADRRPLRRGSVLAVLSAVAFGATTPFIQRFGHGAGPVATAFLLYMGAAIASLGKRRVNLEAPVRRGQIPRLLLVGLLGAVAAPVCFAWGLQRTGALGASLLLNLEAFFTLVLARVFFHEPINRRVSAAVLLMMAGGVSLVIGGHSESVPIGLGALAVIAAALGWALDNLLTRPLADLDPLQVVRWKASLGAAFGAVLSVQLHEPRPSLGSALALVFCGATGYGVSLRLYLLAQRQMGAARTTSIFALAPFVGAATSWAMGDRELVASSGLAVVLFGAGVYLHITELHGHAHQHEPLEHEHAHRHDDGHHDHEHDDRTIAVEHSHSHRHDARVHDHPHAPDAHHAHGHKHH